MKDQQTTAAAWYVHICVCVGVCTHVCVCLCPERGLQPFVVRGHIISIPNRSLAINRRRWKAEARRMQRVGVMEVGRWRWGAGGAPGIQEESGGSDQQHLPVQLHPPSVYMFVCPFRDSTNCSQSRSDGMLPRPSISSFDRCRSPQPPVDGAEELL